MIVFMSISTEIQITEEYLLLIEASWTVAEANFVLRIPPHEIMWFGYLDF